MSNVRRIQSHENNSPKGESIVIDLTQGKKAIIDAVDYSLLSEYKWCFNVSRKNMGYALRNSYPVDRKHPVKIYMHRILVGAKKGEIVDHINRNTLDNRRSNLRIVDRGTNVRNSYYYDRLLNNR